MIGRYAEMRRDLEWPQINLILCTVNIMGIVINPSNASKKETAIALFRITRIVAVPKKLVSGQPLS